MSAFINGEGHAPVKYAAYKPKRHSRTNSMGSSSSSSNFKSTPNWPKSSSTGSISINDMNNNASKVDTISDFPSNTGVILEASSKPLESSSSASAATMIKASTSDLPLLRTVPPATSTMTASTALTSSTNSSLASSLPTSTPALSSSASSASTSTLPSPNTLTTHTSTFRRVRPHASSPLARPNSVILPKESPPTSTFIPNLSESSTTSALSAPASPIRPTAAQICPTSSSSPLTSSVSVSDSNPPPATVPLSPPPPTVLITSPSESRITPAPTLTLISNPPTSTSPTSAVSKPAQKPSTKAPYRPGFQPTGLTRFRTDEFLAARKVARDGPGNRDEKRVERTKLERRLEKIISLHFPIDIASSVSRGNLKGEGPGKETKNEKDNEKEIENDRTKKENGRSARPSLLGSGSDSRRRTSSFFENFDIRRMSNSLIVGVGTEIESIRCRLSLPLLSSEQRISPWQPDSSVARCPHCDTSFHPLSNRKHHCRLCGRVVCALGIKRPQRPEPCSILFVVDPKTRQIEQVEEGVDYGVRKRRPSASVDLRSTNSPFKVPVDQGKDTKKINEDDEEAEEEKFLKGVRICRECKPVLLRQQYLRERAAATTAFDGRGGGGVGEFLRLYEAFLALEKEIEDSLPQFEELLVGLKLSDGNPTETPATLAAAAAAERKRLLQAFARYDALAKRIRSLPCKDSPSSKGPKGNDAIKGGKDGGMSSQERVQAAIAVRAARFLEVRMVGLGAVPVEHKRSGSKSKTHSQGTPPLLGRTGSKDSKDTDNRTSSSHSSNSDSTLHATLQPLLEQESLLESYIAEATKARKFEDAKILRGNLREIKGEIERVMRGGA
ncbi:FYVE zinc finger-domain-containing protein [Lentinula aciculospora]|uniref:FYVE zinc finger-domain-containing protein n=1 Tax=Lentinula aciculospora TaxID=153920 RepID=A0A9W9AQ51_9AGAR|nr:FYVE zinc finger-domain-containing protein [Lentinula aciculospora]KAJ4488517.1 FYVE zinc finger-domain-containing protein [Lentinula aciculospora]